MINALFATDYYGGMGINGTRPWPTTVHNLDTLKRLTTNHVVIMGHGTWKDPIMPKPFLGRIVYVATQHSVAVAGTVNGDIVEHALRLERENPDRIIWITGGPELIQSCVNILDAVYLTHVKGSFKIDTRMELKTFLTGFVPVKAEVAADFRSTLVKYTPIFKRQHKHAS
jgi:dihydrofolate reductase